MAEPRHWRRPLKHGGIEFFFRSEDGQWMRGFCPPFVTPYEMQIFFERSTGCVLPVPEIKPKLGAK